MSTYIKTGKSLEYDNAPDWLAAYMRYRRTILGNTPHSVMTDFISLREYFQWLSVYTATGASPKTEEQLRQVDILDMPLYAALQVKRNDVETYLYFCTDTLGNAPKTRTKKLGAIRCFYNYVLDQNEVLHTSLEYNPAERIRSPKPPKKQPIYLPENERTSLLNAVSGENADRDYAILLLLAVCGLRVSEVVQITNRDINFAAATIRIHGKGNKERIAYPTPACLKTMEQYRDGYRKLSGAGDGLTAPFFVSKRTGKAITTRTVERMMQKAANAAGIGGMGFTPHKLRHTMATILAQSGTDLLIIQQLLGHESTQTTQIYTHLGNDDIARAVAGSSLMGLGEKDT